MSTNKTNNIENITEKVTTMFIEFLNTYNDDHKGKIKINDLIETFKGDDTQENLKKVISENLPKRKISREKKLKDPNAPKRPKSSYLFFCDEKRGEVKQTNPEMKATEISQKLGELWKGLSDKKKAKYVKQAETAKEEYKEAMVGYERPSDEELAELDVNKRRRGSKGEKKGKGKKKKDPNAPKRPMTAFLYFSQEKRAEVKEANPDMKPTEITTELGRMWKEDYADEKSKKKWVKMAEKDKARYQEELADYTPPESDAPQKKSKSKSKESKSKESAKDKNTKTKAEISMSTAKQIASAPKVSKLSEEEDLFEDEDDE